MVVEAAAVWKLFRTHGWLAILQLRHKVLIFVLYFCCDVNFYFHSIPEAAILGSVHSQFGLIYCSTSIVPEYDLLRHPPFGS